MKRIVLCFDGTWNAITSDPTIVTNVVKFANAVNFSSKDGTSQVVYYNSGVGSGGPIDRFLGGAFGFGLRSNVKRGLAFLTLNYEKRNEQDPGDEIYIFGFSRGAYTARALAAILGVAGIPQNIGEFEVHWDYYRRYSKLRLNLRKAKKKSAQKQQSIQAEIDTLLAQSHKHARLIGAKVPITCVGVWDTVGAYGIPMSFGLSAIPRLFTYWTRGFRDTGISTAVALGLHALAIDERRPPFTPTYWTPERDKKAETLEGREVEQVWFAGVHSNVGGGYRDAGLSDLALAWMIARVSKATGLEFNETYMQANIWPCTASTLYRTGRRRLFRRPREILPVDLELMLARVAGALKRSVGIKGRRVKDRINEMVHWSVLRRRDCETTIVDGLGFKKYAPPNLPAEIQKVTQPLDLERRLTARTRAWEERCPLQGKRPCECQARDQHELATQQRSALSA